MAGEQQGCDRHAVSEAFFDPLNTMVISSTREKPSRRRAKVRIVITAASSDASEAVRRPLHAVQAETREYLAYSRSNR
jgi:hypothetical protein